jgi:hypothetical protein
MSNIQDITSLSDLLTTSPNQPSETDASRSLRLDKAKIEKSAGDLSELSALRVEGEQSTRVITDQTSTSKILDLALDSQFSDPDPSALDSTYMDTLLAKQSIKLNLNTQRNELLRKRTSLQTQVDDLRIKQKRLNDKRQQVLAKQKLDQLLEQNNTDNRPQRSFSTNDDDTILKQLHVLPSTDWSQRLVQIRRFFSRIEIDRIDTSNHYDRNTLVRTIEFRIIVRMLFRFPVKLLINTKDDSLSEIIINESNIPSPLIITLNMLSPSFTNVLMNNYIPRKKINLVFCGLSSLANLLHTRIAILYRLINKFSKYLVGINLSKLLEKEELDNIFAILKTVDTLNFQFEVDKKIHKVRLQWEIKLFDLVTAECESQLELSIMDDVGYVFPDINNLFLKLVRQNGVEQSFETIIETTYKIVAT